jgi:hypothetical protein
MPEPPEHAGPYQRALGLLMALLPELEFNGLGEGSPSRAFHPTAPGFLAAAYSAICLALPLDRVEFSSAAAGRYLGGSPSCAPY